MIDILLKLGGLQAVLLAVFLFRKKINNNANIYLAILVFALGISCFLYAFNNLEFYLQFPHLIRVGWGIPLLFGPLIYLYTLALVKGKNPTEKQYPHFFPYLINLIILIPFFIKTGEAKIQILDYFTASIAGGTDSYLYYNLFLRWAISIISLKYAFDSLKILRLYKQKLLNEYSSIQKLKLDWLRILLYAFMLLSVIFIVVSLFTYGDRYPQFDYNVYYFFFVFIFIYVLTYKALSQPEIISFDSLIIKPKAVQTKQTAKLSKEGQALKNYMQHEKPYLNGELTASELAEALQLSRHQLSQILNEQIGQNFYDFINTYRAQEFKRRLQLPENNHLTLLGIAFDSGFNSKTTFNTIFKKLYGLTPSQYKKSLK